MTITSKSTGGVPQPACAISSNAISISGDTTLTVRNSRLEADYVLSAPTTSVSQLFGSQIVGDVSGTGTKRVVHCYDSTFAPTPDESYTGFKDY